MIRLVYSFIAVIFSPVWAFWMLRRARARNTPPNWRERVGKYQFQVPSDKGRLRIWFHAVSVGEFLAAIPILRELKFINPDCWILVTVTTSSGYLTAEQKNQESALFDELAYFPIDLPWMVGRALSRVRPHVAVLMETELWLNFLGEAQRRKIRTMLVNGRISDKSYAASQRILPYYRAAFRHLNWVGVQTSTDLKRVRTYGSTSASVVGNCKFDQAIQVVSESKETIQRRFGMSERPTLVIGSTRGEIEEIFVNEALALIPLETLRRWQIVWAPRHIERGPEIARIGKELGLEVGIRSQDESGCFLVLDTYGELNSVYVAADLAVIGGGFDRLGGQNLIQPLALGKPVIHGPFMENFAFAVSLADAKGAAQAVDSPAALAAAIQTLLENASERERMGESAKALIAENAGASVQYAEAILVEAASGSAVI